MSGSNDGRRPSASVSFAPDEEGSQLDGRGGDNASAAIDALSDAASDVAVTVNAGAIAASLRIPPALQVRMLGEAKGIALRIGHTMVSFEGGMYVYGGRSPVGSQYYGTVTRYLPSRVSWMELEAKGIAPPRRGDHTAVVVDEKMYVYGGRKQNLVYDDMYAFDFILKSWERVLFDGSGSPGAVYNHSTAYCQTTRTMFVVGGVHLQANRTKLVFAFDMRGQYWKAIPGPPTVDTNELQLCMCCVDDAAGKLVVLGAKEDPTLAAMYQEMSLTFNGSLGSNGAGNNSSNAIRREDDEESTRQSFQQQRVSGSSLGGGPAGAGGAGHRNKMTSAAETSFTMMLVMDVHTRIWKRVRTEVSPESPIVFSMEHVACSILANLTRQSGAISTTKRLVYFPVNLREVDAHGGSVKPGPPSRGGKPPHPPARHGRMALGKKEVSEDPKHTAQHLQRPPWMATFGCEYGVLILSLVDLTWSLSPLTLPKKKTPLPGEDTSSLRREFYTLRTAPELERKYTFIVHHNNASGSTVRELLTLYGGTGIQDYTFSVMTPALPPRAKARADASRNSPNTKPGWSLLDDGEEDGDADKLATESAQDSISQATISRPVSATPNSQSLVPPVSDHPLASNGGPTTSKLPHVYTSHGATARSGKKGGKRTKEASVRVIVPVQASTGAAAQHTVAYFGAQAPVAILESKERLNQWVHQYYKEECKWISEQRFAIEKQFVMAKRNAVKPKDRGTAHRQNEEIVIPIPGRPQPPARGGAASAAQSRRQEAAMQREVRVRTGAVVGTLLFDAVDLHPDVKPRAPSPPKRRSSTRGLPSPFRKRNESGAASPTKLQDDDAPLTPTQEQPEGGRRGMSIMTIPNAIPHLLGQKKIEEATTEGTRIAHLNWALLRRHVLSGEAARVLSKIEEEKCPDISWWQPQTVSSAPQLVMQPSLSTFTIVKGTGGGAMENKRLMSLVPTKPVPYQLAPQSMHQLNASAGESGVMRYVPKQPQTSRTIQ